MLKMLTVLHRMQLHSAASPRRCSRVGMQAAEAQLDELRATNAAAGGTLIRGYLGYLRLRLQAPEWAAAAATAARRPLRLRSVAALPQALGQLPEWQNLDAAIDGFDAAGGVGG